MPNMSAPGSDGKVLVTECLQGVPPSKRWLVGYKLCCLVDRLLPRKWGDPFDRWFLTTFPMTKSKWVTPSCRLLDVEAEVEWAYRRTLEGKAQSADSDDQP